MASRTRSSPYVTRAKPGHNLCSGFSFLFHLFSGYLFCQHDPRRSKVRFAPTSFLLLADASAAKKPPSHRSLAPPFPQKAPLGSPVRLQARSQRLAVATNLLRLPRLAAREMGRGVHAAPKKRAAGRDNMACARLKNRHAGA